jgi:hypothetical protein
MKKDIWDIRKSQSGHKLYYIVSSILPSVIRVKFAILIGLDWATGENGIKQSCPRISFIGKITTRSKVSQTLTIRIQ